MSPSCWIFQFLASSSDGVEFRFQCIVVSKQVSKCFVACFGLCTLLIHGDKLFPEFVLLGFNFGYLLSNRSFSLLQDFKLPGYRELFLLICQHDNFSGFLVVFRGNLTVCRGNARGLFFVDCVRTLSPSCWIFQFLASSSDGVEFRFQCIVVSKQVSKCFVACFGLCTLLIHGGKLFPEFVLLGFNFGYLLSNRSFSLLQDFKLPGYRELFLLIRQHDNFSGFLDDDRSFFAGGLLNKRGLLMAGGIVNPDAGCGNAEQNPQPGIALLGGVFKSVGKVLERDDGRYILIAFGIFAGQAPYDSESLVRPRTIQTITLGHGVGFGQGESIHQLLYVVGSVAFCSLGKQVPNKIFEFLQLRYRNIVEGWCG